MYEDWIAKKQAIERTGLTARTLERMVKDGKLQREYVHVPGRKSLPVFHPVEIQQLTDKTLKPTPLPTKKATQKATEELAITASQLVAMSLSFSHLRYFTEKQAAYFLGVSPTYISLARKAGALPAVKLPGVRGLRYERQTLRHHTVSLFLSVLRTKRLNGNVEKQLID